MGFWLSYTAGMIDPTFVFSQRSLSDFQDCPRRFYLRYIARLAWPVSPAFGLDAARHEAHLRRGATLHRWIERYWLGIPAQSPAAVQPLTVAEEQTELLTWWRRFLDTDFSGLPPQRLPELSLVAALGRFRLAARFDLLAIEDGGRAVIVDWKTSRSRALLDAEAMRRRLQTRVYLYTLATAGAAYYGGAPIDPAQCQLRYWLASFPAQPWIEIPYSAAEYQADCEQLLDLAGDAARRSGEEQFPRTDDERYCARCAYRVLCRRDGALDAMPQSDDDDGNDNDNDNNNNNNDDALSVGSTDALDLICPGCP